MTAGAERRLAAILSATPHLYAELHAADPAGVGGALEDYQELIEREWKSYNGRASPGTSEELLLAFDEAIDATQCAIDIQKAVRERNSREPEADSLDFCIGLHLGYTQVAGEQVTGVPVWIAQSLRGLAGPGEICASRLLLDEFDGKLKLDLEDLHERWLPGLPDPVHAFKIIVPEHEPRRMLRIGSLRTLTAAGTALAVLILGSWFLLSRLITDLEAAEEPQPVPVAQESPTEDPTLTSLSEPGMAPMPPASRHMRTGVVPAVALPDAHATTPGVTRYPAAWDPYEQRSRAMSPLVAHLPSTPAGATQFTVDLPAAHQLGEYGGLAPPIALSPDGRTLAYVAQVGTHRELFVRRFDEPEPRAISGSEGARAPFFSPDGRFVGFWTKDQLRGASVDGGVLWPIADVPGVRGASWGPRDTIVFADLDSGLWRVQARGGTPERLTSVDEAGGELYHAWPQVLPGGRRVLFTSRARDGLRLTSIPLRGGTPERLFPVGAGARYVGTGHLVYAEQGFLVALPFDPGRLALQGSPVPVFAGVYTSSRGSAYFAAATSGMLAYVPDPALSAERTLVWVDRDGGSTPIAAGAAYEFPRLSPDGRAVAYTVHTADSQHEVWVHDLHTSRALAVSADENSLQPAWSPDGRELVFTAGGDRAVDLYAAAADGRGPSRPLLVRARQQVPGSWSRDGTVLAFSEFHPTDGPDLWALPASGDPWPILASPASESAPALSPDGDWLAYVSDASGRDEVYIRPFPGPGDGRAVSTGGGREPVWSRDGGELFYRNSAAMLVVRIEPGATLRAWAPVVLFERDLEPSPNVHSANFDVARDSQSFVMVEQRSSGRYAASIRVVTNWTGKLQKRMAAR